MRVVHLSATLTVLFCVCPLLEANCKDQMQLPTVVLKALQQKTDIALSCRLKPSLITGDFDGDGRPDYAVLVIQSSTKKRGFLIAFGGGTVTVVGAGRSVQYGSDSASDLNFDHWELYKTSSAEPGEKPPLKVRCNAVFVSYEEAASGIFYWDGKRIRWFQQGD
jgi:hypothetical protein